MEQLALSEVQAAMEYDAVKKIVMDLLKEYPRLPHKIRTAERKAAGKGLDIPMSTSMTDLGQPEYMRLSPREQRLASVGRSYLGDIAQALTQQKQQLTKKGLLPVVPVRKNAPYMHQQKAENLFHAIAGDDEEDEALLDQIRTMMVGTRYWRERLEFTGSEGIAISRADERTRAEAEAERLRNKQEAIEEAMDALQTIKPHLEQLLRARFILDKKVIQVTQELNISESTYDNWLKEAICEFALLAGIIEG